MRIAGDFAQIGKEFQLLTNMLPALGSGLASTVAIAGPAVLAVGALAFAFKTLTDQLEKEKETIQSVIKGVDTYFTAMYSMTTEAANKALDDLSSKTAQATKERDFLRSKLPEGVDENSIAVASPAVEALQNRIKELNKQILEAGIASDALTSAEQDGALAANDAAEAMKKQTQANLDAAKKQSDQAKQDYADSQLSVDAAKKKAEQLKVNIDADQQELSSLMALGDESPEVQKRIEALKESLRANGEEWDKLRSVFIPAAENAKKLADAEAKRKKNTEELIKAEEKNNQDIANTYKKYKDDVASIEQKSAEERASINKKLADTLVAEAQKALEQSQDALRKLEDKRADLLDSYNKGELDAQQKAAYDDQTLQINAQREEVKAYQEHLQRLDDIRKSEWANEQQALLDRNFVALAKSRLTVATNMNQENTSFGRSQQDRAATLAASKQDAERQRAQEHAQRLEAYQQANADANKQYQRELRDQQIARERAIAAAQKAHDEDLKMLAQKTRAELDARAKAEKAELEIMIKGAKARVELEAKTQEALLNEAKAFAGARISTNAANPHSGTQFNLSLGQYARRAGGGPLSAGQPAIVNDGSGRETFNGQLLPGGAGIFYPLKSGVVSGATGGTQFHQENHISGVSDPKAVADMIKQQTVTLLEQVLNG